MKNIIITLILILISIHSCFATDKIYTQDQVNVYETTYSIVDMTNPIAVWEEEFNVPRKLSHILKIKQKIELKADIYTPYETQTGRPVLFLIHGGAFMPGIGGRKDDSMVTLGFEFAKRGFTCISIDYREMNIITPSFLKAGYTAAQDAKSAINYFVNNHKEFNIDPHNIFIGGISAGAITAINSVYLDDDDDLLGRTFKFDRMYGCLECTSDDLLHDFTIKGIINISGGIFNTNIFDNNRLIPIISFHGLEDDVVPIACDLPFKEMAFKYNVVLNSMKLIARSNNMEKFAQELEEAKIETICGSRVIDNYLSKFERKSYFLEFDKADHYVVCNSNGVLTKSGKKIISSMSKFMAYFSKT